MYVSSYSSTDSIFSSQKHLSSYQARVSPTAAIPLSSLHCPKIAHHSPHLSRPCFVRPSLLAHKVGSNTLAALLRSPHFLFRASYTPLAPTRGLHASFGPSQLGRTVQGHGAAQRQACWFPQHRFQCHFAFVFALSLSRSGVAWC